MWKTLLLVLLLQTLGTNSFAACENFLRGFTVDSKNYGSNPNEVTYYAISSQDLGLTATIAAYSNQCTGPDCLQMLDTLSSATGTGDLIRLAVRDEICNNLSQYTLMINGGGSCDMIPVEKILSVNLDPNYPF